MKIVANANVGHHFLGIFVTSVKKVIPLKLRLSNVLPNRNVDKMVDQLIAMDMVTVSMRMKLV
jgi:hypothetical protein